MAFKKRHVEVEYRAKPERIIAMIRLVPPATHNDFKMRLKLGPQFGSGGPAVVIVIDVRVVAGDRVRNWRAAQCSLTFALAGTLFGGLRLGGDTF